VATTPIGPRSPTIESAINAIAATAPGGERCAAPWRATDPRLRPIPYAPSGRVAQGDSGAQRPPFEPTKPLGFDAAQLPPRRSDGPENGAPRGKPRGACDATNHGATDRGARGLTHCLPRTVDTQARCSRSWFSLRNPMSFLRQWSLRHDRLRARESTGPLSVVSELHRQELLYNQYGRFGRPGSSA
jgi:hypothetical protein